MNGPTVFEKEMGLDHAEFHRTIANALGTDAFERRDDGVTLTEAGRRLEVTLGPEGERKIALLRIPVTRVTLTFSGYSEDEIDAAVKRFDMTFKKGGG